jgi:chorismate mutase
MIILTKTNSCFNESYYIYAVELLEFIFRLGVVFAIYGFLWGLIEMGIRLFSIGRDRPIVEVYLIKSIKYIFLADVTIIFCIQGKSAGNLVINQLIFAGFILLTYFISKLQNSQKRVVLFQLMNQGNINQEKSFNIRAEIVVIAIGMITFGLLMIFPEKAFNPLSSWFHTSILNIENTPIFGFIFKVIGFFFLVTILFKMANAFAFLLSGGRITTKGPNDSKKFNNEKDDYDDFEEVN